jgi:nitrous oxide reductase accessory protein NosL
MHAPKKTIYLQFDGKTFSAAREIFCLEKMPQKYARNAFCFVTDCSDEAKLLTLNEYHKTSVRWEYAHKRITKRYNCMYNRCEPLHID